MHHEDLCDCHKHKNIKCAGCAYVDAVFLAMEFTLVALVIVAAAYFLSFCRI
jgi:hypothetical protein